MSRVPTPTNGGRVRTWIRLAVVVVAGATAVVSCGGSSKPSVSTHPTTTVRERTTTSTTPPSSTTGARPPKWTAVPAAPIAGRIAAGVVWTGTEMIAWGGVVRGDTIASASDGAAYDPASRTWRTLAPAPSGVAGDVGTAAVWTGAGAVFWAGNSPDGPALGAVYDPAADSWRRLPRGPLGPRESYASVWTGTELLIIGGNSGDQGASPVAGAVNPRTGVWRLLTAMDRFPGLRLAGEVWDGHLVFASGTYSLCPGLGSACPKRRSIFFVFNPATDAVREIHLPRSPSASLAPVGWTGSEVVFTTTANGTTRIVRYRPATGSWDAGPSAPCRVPDPYYTQSLWFDGRYASACVPSRLQIYTASTNSWMIIDTGSSPFTSRAGSAVVWTGHEIVAWSGTVRAAGNRTPNDGASIALRR